MPGTATYLYCIVHASRAPSITRAPSGLPAATRPALTPLARSFWLVAASIPLDVYGREILESSLRNVQWVTDIALAHESVVEYFARLPGVTAIPMKLFTMFSSPQMAVAKTRSHVRRLERVVERIAGCEEWGVRITRRSGTAGAPTVPVKAASGTEFLAATRMARLIARQSANAADEAAEHAYTTLATIAR